jgi:hypothetical protein
MEQNAINKMWSLLKIEQNAINNMGFLLQRVTHTLVSPQAQHRSRRARKRNARPCISFSGSARPVLSLRRDEGMCDTLQKEPHFVNGILLYFQQ